MSAQRRISTVEVVATRRGTRTAGSGKSAPGGRKNVVERAIEKFDGQPSEFARRLSEYVGEEITRQRVHGWRLRGVFPREVILAVSRATGMSIEELSTAKSRIKELDEANIVERAIRLLGEEGTPAKLAAELSKLSGRKVTSQIVHGWQLRAQFPLDMVPFVHMLVKIPVKELIPGRG